MTHVDIYRLTKSYLQSLVGFASLCSLSYVGYYKYSQRAEAL